jgi:hypothetical protein
MAGVDDMTPEDPYGISALFNLFEWDWAARINKSLNDGKLVVRKIGPQWYLIFATIEPVKVSTQAMAMEVIDDARHYFKMMGLI